MNDAPVMTTAIVTSLVTAVISLLTAFGVPMTPEQTAAILGVVGVIAPWAVWYVSHRTTTPLSNPTTETGLPLSGPNGELTQAQTRSIMKED